MGSSLNPINSSLIATALVPIAAAFHVSAGRTAVLVSSLYLARGAGGQARDIPRRIDMLPKPSVSKA
jgi:hypothetical protein